MNHRDLEHFRNALQNHRDTLLEWLDSESGHRNLHLASAKNKDVQALISELKDSLERIESGEFGRCEVCNSEVEANRLAADFTASICLDCYSASQLRTLESELELVSQVQKDLLPCKVPKLPGIEIAAQTESAGIVGGDYYDFYNCQSGAQGLVIADVMNKGLPASMLMSNLQASLRILGPQVKGVNFLAERLNELFRHNLNLIRFISIFLTAIYPDSRTLKYCNAGHHPALWWRASSKSFQWLNPTGPALGLTHEPRYTTETVEFESGDLFVLYTDGLVEAGSQNGKEFGEKRLAAYVKEHVQEKADAILSGLLEAAQAFAGKFNDDVTLVILKVE